MRMRPDLRGLLAAALATLSLAGCGLVNELRGPGAAAPLPPPGPRPQSPIEPDLALISRLPQEDPASQAERFQAAKDAAQLTPTTSNRLRYALALATPGHSGSDPVAAERQLSQILARPETLLPEERMLATIELRQVEQRLILQAENRRLRAQAERAGRDRLAVADRRLAAEAAENARLRKSLDDALAKLDAVSHLERSINDRTPGGTPPP